MIRALLVIAAAVALYAGVVVGASPEGRTAPTRVSTGPHLSQLLALTGGTVGGSLVQLDPRTLRPQRGQRIPVGPGGCASMDGGTACWAPAWSVSPDGKRVALAESTPLGLRDAASVRLVDPAAMRTIATISVPGDAIGALAWLGRDRVLAVQEATGGMQRVVAVDLPHRRIVAQHPLGGSVERLATTRDALVLLLAPPNAIGPARVAVVGADGTVRDARLARIRAGARMLGGAELRTEYQSPGLALDPDGQRAFVVAKGMAAEIDLRTLAVSYHDLDRKASFLGRIWNWLDPSALAKEYTGQVREAGWLGNGLLAVSGSDATRGALRPAGLAVVDTTSWKVQTIDPDAMSFTRADDLLVATGGRWDDKANREIGIGLSVYGLDGTLRVRLFDGRQAWAQVYRGRAFVSLGGGQTLRVVDLARGAITGMRSAIPLLLLGSSGGRWG
jgi:hypothetical protein